MQASPMERGVNYGKKSICTCNSYYYHKEYRALKSRMNLQIQRTAFSFTKYIAGKFNLTMGQLKKNTQHQRKER